MIVVVIIGLLTALALPALNTVHRRSQASTIANDFRTFRDAIETYVLENGTFPNMAGAGFPPVFNGWISRSKWIQGSALDTPGQNNIEISSIVEDILDDGNQGYGHMLFDGAWIGWIFER